ncbi:MAG TPA: hypothetical protein VK730_08085 [Solirubrobacteraceae bacterium]|nr:hypothetical protein [Solirubrobacteraceae bacterium]
MIALATQAFYFAVVVAERRIATLPQTKRYTAVLVQGQKNNGESSADATPRDEFEAFEVTLRTLSERVRKDDAFAHELYGALCNMRWRRRDADSAPVSMSWRYAGGIVAHLACKGGCYLDYHCSGNEGAVSPRIRDALGALGWISAPWPEDETSTS